MAIGGKATYANKPLADMLGYSRRSFQTSTCSRDLSRPKAPTSRPLEKLAAGVADGRARPTSKPAS